MTGRSIRRALVVAAVALSLALRSASSLSAGAPSILVISEPTDALAIRLRAELVALGYDVVSADRVDRRRMPPGTAGMIVVDETAEHVEIWTTDHDEPKLRETLPATPQGSETPELVALKVVEHVRAFVSAPSDPVVPEHVEARPVPAPRIEAPPETHRWAAGAEVAVLVPVGGASPGANLALRGRFAIAPWLGVGMFVGVPVVPSSLSRAAGDAALRAYLFAAEVDLRVTSPRAWCDVDLDAGVMAADVAMAGTAKAPFEGTNDSVVTSVPFVGAAFAPRLTPQANLRFAALAGTTAPAADIRFAGVTTASWGRPLIMISAGGELVF